MSDVQGGNISAHETMLSNSPFWLIYYLLKRPKVGIQLPNSGDDNQGCHILRVIFNQMDRLRVTQYNIYSGTLFYTNLSNFTSLQVCGNMI